MKQREKHWKKSKKENKTTKNYFFYLTYIYLNSMKFINK